MPTKAVIDPSLSLLLLPLLLAVLAVVLPGARPASAEGGKWTPEQILDLDPEWLRELGLEIPPSELWSEGEGLLSATVQVRGCSAGFVSASGLMLTNHHCAFGLLQEHATPENDLIEDGFTAARGEDELPASSYWALIPHRFVDVTAEVEAAAAEAKDDLERYRAIERKQKELVAACEAQPFRRCRVVADDDGVAYRLIETLEYPDVRLVYAPPRSVGEFGGEVDNWSWPRHTGDFALLRVYAGADNQPAPVSPANRPYRPKHHFPVAAEGAGKGDFVMVTGYPGSTYRSWTADEASERLELFFPERAALYRDWIDRMEDATAGDEAGAIALAGRVKSLQNREKNARGQIAGIRRGDLLRKKREAESEVLAWARSSEEHRGAVEAYEELARLAVEARETWHRRFLLSNLAAGAMPLELAVDLARWAREREKADLDRVPKYQERNRDRLLDDQRLSQKRLYLPAEKRLLADQLRRFHELPEGQRIAAVEALLADRTPAEAAEELLTSTRVMSLEAREEMFTESEGELRERGDALLDLGLALAEAVEAMEAEEDTRAGAHSRLRPAWRRAMAAHAGRPIDPDANASLRVSLAHVEGYQPEDGVWMLPHTTLSGVVAKHAGEDPFDVPESVLKAAAKAPESRWADPELKDVPVCFLADGDTTGGNSGSPVLNGRGELVGVNFDRVWENVANDFGYNPAIARNISVDVRYLLWMLDEVAGEGAERLLGEMGVAEE